MKKSIVWILLCALLLSLAGCAASADYQQVYAEAYAQAYKDAYGTAPSLQKAVAFVP